MQVVEVLEQAPPHPEKVCPTVGVAVSTTVVEVKYFPVAVHGLVAFVHVTEVKAVTTLPLGVAEFVTVPGP